MTIETLVKQLSSNHDMIDMSTYMGASGYDPWIKDVMLVGECGEYRIVINDVHKAEDFISPNPNPAYHATVEICNTTPYPEYMLISGRDIESLYHRLDGIMNAMPIVLNLDGEDEIANQ